MSKKLLLIAPGYKPFPPQGWGAVESIVWDYYENFIKRKEDYNIDVIIINQSDPNKIIEECNSQSADIVHIMYDDYIIIVPYLNCRKIFYTSHYAYITHPTFETSYQWYFRNIFSKVIEYQNRITINVISKEIKDVYIKYGFKQQINIVRNGAREDLFRFSTSPEKPKRSVYVAKIEKRKAQYKYQCIPKIDFVGNYHDSEFNCKYPNYLGEWDKPTLYENLTDYGNLILLSEGEADPLVVKEALVAGLGVVISECSTANLDLTRPFITVIPNDKLNDLGYISNMIEVNRRASLENRQEIRKYALENFAWNKIIDKYVGDFMK